MPTKTNNNMLVKKYSLPLRVESSCDYKMTKAAILKYLRANRQYINISAIAKEAGMNVSALHNVVREGVDGHGRPATLSDKHVVHLNDVITRMQATRKILNIVKANCNEKSSDETYIGDILVLYQIQMYNEVIVAFSATVHSEEPTKEAAFKKACEKICPKNFELIKPKNRDEIEENPDWYLDNFHLSEVDYFDLMALNEDQTNWFRQVIPFAI